MQASIGELRDAKRSGWRCADTGHQVQQRTQRDCAADGPEHRRYGRFGPRATEHRERALERNPRGQAHQGTCWE